MGTGLHCKPLRAPPASQLPPRPHHPATPHNLTQLCQPTQTSNPVPRQVVPLANPAELWPVLACQDRYVRVLRGSEPVYEAPTPAAPVSLQYVVDSHDPQHRFPNAKEVLYGTDTGERRRGVGEGRETEAGVGRRRGRGAVMRCAGSRGRHLGRDVTSGAAALPRHAGSAAAGG